MTHAVQGSVVFLGVDLKRFFSLWYQSITEALNRPAFSWLGIQEPVTVSFANKPDACFLAYQPNKKIVKTSYQAIVLPDDGVLYNEIKMPVMDDDDLRSALALQMTSISPFPQDDLAWGYLKIASDKERVSIQLALTSRRLVAQQIELVGAKITRQQVEVWASSPTQMIVIQGYGEDARFRKQGRNLAQAGLALFFGVGVLIGLAAIPTIIRHHQLEQATALQSQLRVQIQPAMEKRDRLMYLQELLETLNMQRIGQPSPLEALDRVTSAFPDDAWLERFELQGQTLQLAGRSSNATALIKTLSSASGLENVKSIAPITRDATSNTDRFVIEANAPAREPTP